MRIFYYPGCASQHLARELHRAVEALFMALELEISILEDWNCCGAREIARFPPTVGWFLATRNLALAEEGILITTCSLCYHNLKRTSRALQKYPEALQHINDILREEGLRYRPERLQILHLLEFLCKKENLARLVSEVKGRGEKIPVVSFYGCFLSRPFPLESGLMEKLLDISGFEVKPYSLAHYCCGGHLPRTDSPVIRELCTRLLLAAERTGARFMGVCCPVCKTNLEIYGPRKDLKVVYLPQLLGMRLGLPPAITGLEGGLI
ncbi:heterodisulfide reductase-related iron-sulfur binding cluster [Thermosulfurimonas sp. F29]|uniref:heterodisulfide reductase-related iron-sulfur binding cluster n=1 Tax=Thermosulfurimonas sp. F29 TaxID=2867247 RepID=UPI001C83BE40|nr:heterodisulfide reductase-related iron-sulfur binding cluster [Thermosulfurimonas sp. F29]MBX6424029.1 hypothetical protein [Thermosulfurimonas sp. F29]